ncbi:hypothetical protein WG904_18195 [Pedobacter sp. Du54]|uniref:hypothetical protein n=1 Tax=Pedobacter anseongensis TaxID=3133439 RepID=UPI00309BCE26
MKHIFTLIFTLSIFSASAQYTASLQKSEDKKNICAERGHSVTYTKSSTSRKPYTIDTKDSTVTVYPVSNATTGKCSRCGAEIESYEKDIRVTTWRRAENAPVTRNPIIDDTNWGINEQRSITNSFKSNNLNEIKKVATLRNDTLFIHKRIAPFSSLKEQVNTVTTVYYKNKPLVFKTAIFDEAAVYSDRIKKGFEIF